MITADDPNTISVREGDRLGGEVLSLEQAGAVGLDGRPAEQQLRLPNGELIFYVQWQHGTTPAEGVNGLTIEQLLEVAAMRLREYQRSEPTRCRENAIALTEIESAQNWLYRRTHARQQQRVEGQYEAHKG